jgi:rare lipoprotein A
MLRHTSGPARRAFPRPWTSSPAGRKRVHAAATFLTLAVLGFGGCAQQPQQVASNHPKEYFPSSVYGPASRRVVTDGPVPHGGGQYLVGKPYTVAGHTYYPTEKKLVQVGNASWYGDAFHGRLTANGEIYDRDSFTAAHPTMPLPSYARVTNLRNNYSMVVRVNDRGPFASNRVMDVSRRVAEALDFKRTGTARIKVEYVGRASLAGSDDAKLYATLRTNGPAPWNEPEPVMTAAAPPPRPAAVAAIEPPPRPVSRPEPIAAEPAPPPYHVSAPRPETAWRAAPALPAPRPAWSAPRLAEHPALIAPPVRTASLAPHEPVMHWQQGPKGQPVPPTRWTSPKAISMPAEHAGSHAPLPPRAAVARWQPARAVHVARARNDD